MSEWQNVRQLYPDLARGIEYSLERLQEIEAAAREAERNRAELDALLHQHDVSAVERIQTLYLQSVRDWQAVIAALAKPLTP